MSALGDYLASGRFKPWSWGEHDCTAFPAIWAGFADALPEYSSEAAAEAMLGEAGGLVPLWLRAVAASGGKAIEVSFDCILPGDVAVVELPSVREGSDPQTNEPVVIVDSVECGAIWTGKRWAFVPAQGGIGAVNSTVPCLKAWRPLCPRR